MANKALMIQGTGSHVGKSLIVAGLCRLLKQNSVRVAPFKPQNMSNNAAVAGDGGEIGRAQALQAYACGILPSFHMNPVLLKPQPQQMAQIIVQGKWWRTVNAREFHQIKQQLMPKILESYQILADAYQVMMIEGAGSPAEINLRLHDLANMGFAEAADVPVVLVADIERGGVIASVLGTYHLFSKAEQKRVKGVIINKFRGDISLFVDGQEAIEQKTGWPVWGIIPYFPDLHLLPPEDSLSIPLQSKVKKPIKIAVPLLPYRANMDDIDPLVAEQGIETIPVHPGQPIPMNCQLVILTGSKSTIADLQFIRQQGWDIDLMAHYRQGGYILGLCGGFQMLGQSIHDEGGIEGETKKYPGLGYFDFITAMQPEKIVREQQATELLSGHLVRGYEIHLGKTTGSSLKKPLLRYDNGDTDGAISKDGRVLGCYLHGLFANDQFRHDFLKRLSPDFSSTLSYQQQTNRILDDWAAHLQQHLTPQFLQQFLNFKPKLK